MKLQAVELPIGKPQPRRKAPKIGPLLIALTVLCTVIPIYYPSLRYAQKILSETSSSFAHVEDFIRPASLLVPLSSSSSRQNSERCSIDGGGIQHCKPSGHGDHIVANSKLEENKGDVKRPPKSSKEDNRPKETKSLEKDVDKQSRSSNNKRDLTTAKALDKDSKTGPKEIKSLEEKDVNKASRSSNEPDLTTAKALDKNSKIGARPGELARTTTPKKLEKRARKRASHRKPEPVAQKKQADKTPRRLPSHDDRSMVTQVSDSDQTCDIFSGEWVPNPEAPYYTNTTCWAIQEHQNCMKFGRPDRGFMKWRWKPDGCELPIFNPHQFLELVRGKSLAFVGDSVARNHMQSLLCLLSRVVYPIDVSNTTDENFKRWVYPDYNFNISIFWAPYLVRTEKTDPKDVTHPFKLFLDEFDEDWRSQIENFDYVIISAGQWFFRPTMFYVNRRIVGCLYCPDTNVTHLTTYFSYRRAFRTAFRAINSLDNFKGITFLRTYAPSHFEGGPWDKGGDCVRTRPFRRNETALEDYILEMYMIQLQELKIAQRLGRKRGLKFRLFDATKAMLLRPDGHPSKYGRWPSKNVTVPNDCVHWCLPGPIDSWNDLLQELLRREVEHRSSA